MVKSITNTKSKIWIAVDIIVLVISVFLIFFSLLQSILLVVVAIVMLYRIKWKSDRLIMDNTEIIIDNWFTTTKTVLDIKKIDRYTFNTEALMGKRLLLISDNLVVAKIRHGNYSNIDELLSHLDNQLNDRPGAIAEQRL
jgi:hypothetical protein